MRNKGALFYFAIAHLFVTLLLLVAVLASNNNQFQANVLQLLPESEISPLLQDAEKAFFEQSKSVVVLSVWGDEKEAVYDLLKEQFRQKHWLHQLNDRMDLQEVIHFYKDYSGVLASDKFSSAIQSPDTFTGFFNSKLGQIANPIVSGTISDDLTMATADFIESALLGQSSLSYQSGRVIAQHGEEKALLLFLKIPDVATDINYSVVVAGDIKTAINEALLEHHNCSVNYSGVLFHTVENSTNAKYEMSVFGGLSMAMIILLVWGIFRSTMPLVWVLSTVSYAVVAGGIGLLTVFEEVHLLSLVFGVTLIGIAIDYCFHVLAHLSLPSKDKNNELSSVYSALVLGFVTTSLGYLMFLLTPIEVLKQVAVFVVSGLSGALAISVLIPLTAKGMKLQVTPPQIIIGLRQSILQFSSYSKPVLLVLSFSALIGLFAFPLKFNDSVALLNASSDELLHNEQLHHQLLGQEGITRLFVNAPDIEALLTKEELVKTQLNQQAPHINTGTNTGIKTDITVTAISDWLPSVKKQQENQEQLKQAFNNQTFEVVRQFAPDFTVNVNSNYLTLDAMRSSPVWSLLENRVYESEQGFVSIMDIKDIGEEQLDQLLSQHKGSLTQFDKKTSLSIVIKTFREHLTIWVLVAGLLVVLSLGTRFHWKVGLASSAILLISVYSALLLSQIFQGYINIFNLLGAILVIGLAVDYLIFYRVRNVDYSNLVAISLSALSSLFVFGMLIFSSTPAVFGVGMTVCLGVTLVYFLAPLSIEE